MKTEKLPEVKDFETKEWVEWENADKGMFFMEGLRPIMDPTNPTKSTGTEKTIQQVKVVKADLEEGLKEIEKRLSDTTEKLSKDEKKLKAMGGDKELTEFEKQVQAAQVAITTRNQAIQLKAQIEGHKAQMNMDKPLIAQRKKILEGAPQK